MGVLAFADGAGADEAAGAVVAVVVLDEVVLPTVADGGVVDVPVDVAVEGCVVVAALGVEALGAEVAVAGGVLTVDVVALGGALRATVAGCEVGFGAGALATTAGCAARGAGGTTVLAKYLSQSELVPLASRYFCRANCARLSPAGVPLVKLTDRASRRNPSA